MYACQFIESLCLGFIVCSLTPEFYHLAIQEGVSDTPINVLKMEDPRLSILQSVHFSSHSEVEGESDGEVEFTVELSRPRKAEKNGECKPLIRSSRGVLSRLSSEEDDSKK